MKKLSIFNFQLSTSKGFTLIELLIAVSIVGVLSSVLLVVTNPLQKIAQANDAKRQQEILQIRQALDAYYNDHGYYPKGNGYNNAPEFKFGEQFGAYMQKVPKPEGCLTGSQSECYIYQTESGAEKPKWMALFAKLSAIKPEEGQAKTICSLAKIGSCVPGNYNSTWACSASGVFNTTTCPKVVAAALPETGLTEPTEPPQPTRSALPTLAPSATPTVTLTPTATATPTTPAVLVWTQRTPASPPYNRHSHSMTYDAQNNKVVLFGGYNISGSYSNDTFVYDTAANTWTQRTPASPPSIRSLHSMTYDAQNNKVVLFGGYRGGSSYSNDTWVYDTAANTWTQRFPTSPPSGRYGHSITYDAQNNKVILFGGYNGSYLNDTWVYDTAANTWTQRTPASPPSVRVHHSMTYDAQNHKAVLFGGYSGVHVNDTWVYDTAANTWTQRTPASPPSVRVHHSMTYDAQNNKVVLFGGYSSSGSYLNDTWVYDTAANTWTQKTPASMPYSRYLHSIIYDAQNNKVVLFGGYSSSGIYLNDTWVYGAPLPLLPSSTAYARVFVTSTTYTGNLGGVTGADAKCMERANVANLGGVWKAWISVGLLSGAASDRLVHATVPYKLLDGQTIANNWTDLIDGSLLYQINKTELGSLPTTSVWTATTTDGSNYRSSLNGSAGNNSCDDWGRADSGVTGRSGSASSINSGWTVASIDLCTNMQHLYCFEQ